MNASKDKMTFSGGWAFGEWSAVVELLRRGWVPANINGTVKNAASFDIYASKGKRQVNLRVKACQPGSRAFQFGGFPPGEAVAPGKFEDFDFTILVSIGQKRDKDEFFIMPSQVVRDAIIERQRTYMSQLKRDRSPHKDNSGHWTLRLYPRKDQREEGGWNLAKKWDQHRENWGCLESQ